jgi:hypothetical protein
MSELERKIEKLLNNSKNIEEPEIKELNKYQETYKKIKKEEKENITIKFKTDF